MTISPKDLNAVVRETYPPPPPLKGWLGFYYDSGFYDSEQGTKEDAGWYCSGKVHPDREEALCELAGFRPFEGSALVEVGRALSTPESEKPAEKPEWLKEFIATLREDSDAITALRAAVNGTPENEKTAQAEAKACYICKGEWPATEICSRCQPDKPAPGAAVRMTEELEHVLRIAQARVDQYGITGAGDDAIAAVRAQAAAQPGKLVKVRELLRRIEWSHGGSDIYDAALAELDEAEGVK